MKKSQSNSTVLIKNGIVLLFFFSPLFFLTSCEKEEDKINTWEGTLTLKVTSRQYCPGISESTQVDVTIDETDAVTIGSGQLSYSGSAYTANLGYTEQAGTVSFSPAATFDRETGTLIIREHRITHDTVFNGEGGIVLSFGNSEPWDYLYLNPIQVDDAVFSPVTIVDNTAMLTDLEWSLILNAVVPKK
jgi:hypothetical protein